MKQVNIIKDFKITNSAQFATQEEAEAWVSYHSEQGNFGQDFSVQYFDAPDVIGTQIALQFLNDTDWKVMRHLDQQQLGIATSLTAEEFQELLHQRQMARESIN